MEEETELTLVRMLRGARLRILHRRWLGCAALAFVLVGGSITGVRWSSRIGDGLDALAADSPIPKISERALEITEIVFVRVPLGKKAVRLWIPRLPNDRFQSAELVEVESSWPYKTTEDPDFGNPLLYLEAKTPKPGLVKVRLRYRLNRREQDQPDGSASLVADVFKRPRGLIVVDEEVRRIAREATRGLDNPLAKAKALYSYVLRHVTYDTSGEGWGRGDVVYACRIGKGNCTDFHSLFMALTLAEGIPARFMIGYPPIPKEPEGMLRKPYHCWAEFHITGQGWIPVDISEAWKRPSRAEYYFGRLDADRVLVSMGRDIRLSPPQAGSPLNYLDRPYAEGDGQPLDGVEIRRHYKEL